MEFRFGKSIRSVKMLFSKCSKKFLLDVDRVWLDRADVCLPSVVTNLGYNIDPSIGFTLNLQRFQLL